jgi:hypothetical protein
MRSIIKLIFITFACITVGTLSVQATTTLRFSVTGTNRATGFSDQAGLVGVNGMRYGIVISTGNGTFSGGGATSYDVFDSSVSQFLSIESVLTDDYYFTPSALPVTSALTATGIDPGGAGGIGSVANAPNGADGLIPGVTTGDPFALMWFAVTPNVNGSYYGVFTDASFMLPGSGSLVDFNAPFLGATADPIKAATHLFGVPEPSRSIFAGLGLLSLVLRRRRD